MVQEVLPAEQLKQEYARKRQETELRDEKKLSDLAKWCRDNDLSEEAGECEQGANRIRFAEKLKATGKDVVALANLATWCAERGLTTEAQRTEAEALRMAPDDDAVHRALRHIRDQATGKWVKAGSVWRAKVVSTSMSASVYAERVGEVVHMLLLGGPNDRLAAIDVEFEALFPETDAQEKFTVRAKPLIAVRAAKDVLAGKPLATDDGLRLFDSTSVHLIIPETPTRSRAVFPSVTKDCGTGYTCLDDQRINFRISDSTHSAIARAVRVAGATVLLVRPQRRVTLTFIYIVPPTARKGWLRFYDYPLIEVALPAPPEEPKAKTR
jgi:hypothetical protein